jgi:hypothetical protein
MTGDVRGARRSRPDMPTANVLGAVVPELQRQTRGGRSSRREDPADRREDKKFYTPLWPRTEALRKRDCRATTARDFGGYPSGRGPLKEIPRFLAGAATS